VSIIDTLNERGTRYGDFRDHAHICQEIKRAMVHTGNWSRLNDVQKQALDVIADKIARILSGDPNYADNWHDIQGYAKLVEDRLPKVAGIKEDGVAVCTGDVVGNTVATKTEQTKPSWGSINDWVEKQGYLDKHGGDQTRRDPFGPSLGKMESVGKPALMSADELDRALPPEIQDLIGMLRQHGMKVEGLVIVDKS
jgi:hypothetical protein